MCSFVEVVGFIGMMIIMMVIGTLFVILEAGLAYFLLGDPSSGRFVLAVSHAGPDIDVGLIGEEDVRMFDAAFFYLTERRGVRCAVGLSAGLGFVQVVVIPLGVLVRTMARFGGGRVTTAVMGSSFGGLFPNAFEVGTSTCLAISGHGSTSWLIGWSTTP
jgi:hypothetical protein